MRYILEACVDSVESAIAAKNGGADRIELCSNLIIGGTSPSIELFNEINKQTSIKSNILIRPRFGDFCYSDYEFEVIKKEVDLFRRAGANGVVIGVLKPDGTLDEKRMEQLIELAGDMEITLHRCFDVTKDPYLSLRQAESLGINTILTSGQENSAREGIGLLDNLQHKTSSIKIMAGGGVNYDLVNIMLSSTSITTFHMSGKKTVDSKMVYRKKGVSMGLPMMSEYEIWETDEKEIRRVRELLDSKL